jgi:hypothetical protein
LPARFGEGIGLGDHRADQRRQQVHAACRGNGGRVGRVTSGANSASAPLLPRAWSTRDSLRSRVCMA